MEISRRQVFKGIFWGRRGVVVLLLVLATSIVGRYDDWRSVFTFLPEPMTVFTIVPAWAWFVIGLLLITLVVFEGTYRYVRTIPQTQAQSDRLAELKFAQEQERRDKEIKQREGIYSDISPLLKRARETIIPATLTVDISSISRDSVGEVLQYIIKNYVETGKHRPWDFTQEELQDDIRRQMEVRQVGISWLIDSKPEVGQIVNDLNNKCSTVRNINLRNSIAQFKELIVRQASIELFGRYVKSKDGARIETAILKGREYWSDQLDKLQVKINAQIDSLLRLEDLK